MIRFKYKEQIYQYPTALNEITLAQRIQFHLEHGAEMDQKISALEELESETRQYEETMVSLEIACRSFSFFTGIPLNEVQTSLDIAQVMNVYTTALQAMLSSTTDDQRNKFEWNGSVWHIAPPEVTAQSTMTFNEFLIAKETVRQLELLGKSKWESLLYLCCVYLRKEGEEFDESWTLEDGEKMNLMQKLPLDIALSVGFFLSNTMSMYLKTSASSIRESRKELA